MIKAMFCPISSGSSGNCIYIGSDTTHILIDAGISGVTAWKVSEELSKVSRAHQVICITHLPQIAAMADYHFMIEKQIKDGSTVTEISPLLADGSLGELARLLGSGEQSEAALSNAKDMLEKAILYKNSL